MEKINQEDFLWIPIYKAKEEKSRENVEIRKVIWSEKKGFSSFLCIYDL